MSGEDKNELRKLVAKEVERHLKEEKKKADEHKRKSKEGQNKRKREERANDNWPSYGTLSTASVPSPSGFLSETPLNLPEGFPPLWAQEYVISDRYRQRELFNL